MRDVSKLRFLCSSFCKQYQSKAEFYIDEATIPGFRHLVVIYEKGGYRGRPDFEASIPADWTEQTVQDLIFWPMKDPKAPYPAWEVPARVHGNAASARNILPGYKDPLVPHHCKIEVPQCDLLGRPAEVKTAALADRHHDHALTGQRDQQLTNKTRVWAQALRQSSTRAPEVVFMFGSVVYLSLSL
jgi:hypothetical protein